MPDSAKFPAELPRSQEIGVLVNGAEVDVLCTNVAYFASASYTGEAEIEIRCPSEPGSVKISPLALGIAAEVSGGAVRFRLEEPRLLHIALEGVSLPLFFYGNPEPVYDGQATYVFEGGRIHEAGEIHLKDNESVYIGSGAVVRGSIRAFGASNIKIYGTGVLDSSCFRDKPSYRTILLHDCSGVTIRDIVMIEPPCWMVMLACCRDVHVDRLKQIGEVVSSDGIDIVGSHNVLIENCMLRNNDDCVVIKGFDWTEPERGAVLHASEDVYGIEVRSCTFVNDRAGNAIEIGHELTIGEVRDVRFHDIDIVSVNGYGAAFSIHAGDRATVRDIVFENIRVEHYYDKLVDFRVMRSMFNRDEERGRIRDILLRNIRVHVSRYNPGYSISVIGGWDAEHPAERITFEDFYLGGEKVTNANQLDLFVKEAKDIVFK